MAIKSSNDKHSDQAKNLYKTIFKHIINQGMSNHTDNVGNKGCVIVLAAIVVKNKEYPKIYLLRAKYVFTNSNRTFDNNQILLSNL